MRNLIENINVMTFEQLAELGRKLSVSLVTKEEKEHILQAMDERRFALDRLCGVNAEHSEVKSLSDLT